MNEDRLLHIANGSVGPVITKNLIPSICDITAQCSISWPGAGISLRNSSRHICWTPEDVRNFAILVVKEVRPMVSVTLCWKPALVVRDVTRVRKNELFQIAKA